MDYFSILCAFILGAGTMYIGHHGVPMSVADLVQGMSNRVNGRLVVGGSKIPAGWTDAQWSADYSPKPPPVGPQLISEAERRAADEWEKMESDYFQKNNLDEVHGWIEQ